MPKKTKQEQIPARAISTYENARVMSEYSKLLENDPTYSLEVDPKKMYKLTNEEKNFIRFYLEYRNVPYVASILKIKVDEANDIFAKYSVQQEIKRINHSLCLRQFQTKMLSIPELAAYLTSFITDENVPEAKQLTTADKVDLAKYLINLNVSMSQAMSDPSIVMTNTFETKVKDMSVETIKSMLTASDNIEKKRALIDKINAEGQLTLEDTSFLETLSVDELLNIVTKLEGEENGESKNS